MNDLAWELYGSNVDTCILLSTQALEIAVKPGINKKFEGQCHHQLGWFHHLQGDYARSLKEYNLALAIWKTINDRKGLARTNGNMGIVYKEQGNYAKALEYYYSALRECEAVQDQKGIAINSSNIGIIYKNLKDAAKAKEFFDTSIRICKEINYTIGIASNYGNLGNLYVVTGEYKKAEENYLKCLVMARELNYNQLHSMALGNLGMVYWELKEPKKSLAYYKEALKLNQETGNTAGVALDLSNIGDIYREQKNIAEAEKYFNRSLKIATEIGNLDLIKDVDQHFYHLYEDNGDFKKALFYYKKFIAERDSLFNEENTRKAVQSEMNYEFEKKEAMARAEQEKKDAVAAAEVRRQKIILWSISGLGLLILGFAVFAYRSFLQKKRANEEIIRQKHLIEEKQKEILDSIYYARRIQHSLLPNEKYIQRYVKNGGA